MLEIPNDHFDDAAHANYSSIEMDRSASLVPGQASYDQSLPAHPVVWPTETIGLGSNTEDLQYLGQDATGLDDPAHYFAHPDLYSPPFDTMERLNAMWEGDFDVGGPNPIPFPNMPDGEGQGSGKSLCQKHSSTVAYVSVGQQSTGGPCDPSSGMSSNNATYHETIGQGFNAQVSGFGGSSWTHNQPEPYTMLTLPEAHGNMAIRNLPIESTVGERPMTQPDTNSRSLCSLPLLLPKSINKRKRSEDANAMRGSDAYPVARTESELKPEPARPPVAKASKRRGKQTRKGNVCMRCRRLKLKVRIPYDQQMRMTDQII